MIGAIEQAQAGLAADGACGASATADYRSLAAFVAPITEKT